MDIDHVCRPNIDWGNHLHTKKIWYNQLKFKLTLLGLLENDKKAYSLFFGPSFIPFLFNFLTSPIHPAIR